MRSRLNASPKKANVSRRERSIYRPRSSVEIRIALPPLNVGERLHPQEILGEALKNNVVFWRLRSWHFSANRKIDAKHFRFSLASCEILDQLRKNSSIDSPFDILGRSRYHLS
jgi:hypothetical protein